MSKVNTFVIPIITNNNISKCLETLYKHTPDNYYVIVIDQTVDNKAYLENHFKTHLWIRSYRNLGFSKAMNTGIKLAQTPYITLANDDLEFMNKAWWQGIVDTFNSDPRIVAVNPMSPKEGSFGYGYQEANKDTWKPPEAYVCNEDKQFVYPKKPNGEGLFYKEEFTQEDYEFLVNNHPRYPKGTMVDALCMWCTVFKKETFKKFGLLDEKFYPGGGEDYSTNCEMYSCAYPEPRDECNEKFHHRMVSSSNSWVWHKWGESRYAKTEIMKPSRPYWNNLGEIWGEHFDVWGHHTDEKGIRRPLKRLVPKYIDEL